MIKCFDKNYYRPQFVRRQWCDLCGAWAFGFDDENQGLEKEYFKGLPETGLTIQVPFTYETPASGIHDENAHPVVWYERSFSAEKLDAQERYILNFEGADYRTDVWVNGIYAGTHTGGTCRFSFDVTGSLREGENKLIVRCEDSFDTRQPRGKQRWLKDSFGCWYVQTTGIWKPVWSEIVSDCRLDRVKITPDIDTESVRMDFDLLGDLRAMELETRITFKDIPVASARIGVTRPSVSLSMDMRCNAFDFKLRMWSPNDPNLYDVEFVVYKNGREVDRVSSYFGMRKIEADEKGVRLNNTPLYQKLILAQNYWRNSGYTMPDADAALHDIAMTKAAGFNGMRIHQKVEDERFLTCCDMEGMLVWGEFPAEYEYGDAGVRNLTDEWISAVNQQYNHPCIITWVPFNESWGIPDVFTSREQQAFTKGIYWLTKAYDPMRPVITNDGWEHTCSDIITLHDYDGEGAHMYQRYCDGLQGILSNRVAHGQYKFAFAQGCQYAGQPIIMSEYGGIAMARDEGWGYNGKVADEAALIKKYDDLTSTVKSIPNVCGYCYTQLADTYQEVNGLLDADHNPKVDLSKIFEINER